MRSTPDRKTGLSLREFLLGRAMRFALVLANALVSITDDMVLDYCNGLADVVGYYSQQIHDSHTEKVACPLDYEEELLRVQQLPDEPQSRKEEKEELRPDLSPLRTVPSLL
ncbi:hypothetical protein NDU88_000089 [Pleurodeles waltl]|uniref:Uncharacterized protein n=1 Tax=Pleurodeles waltl TaxID=8319 RepID=A0AAV7S4N9_PLEWA|nr:hypothetical protein NDU88_000089 [Pleurodeles waltl]